MKLTETCTLRSKNNPYFELIKSFCKLSKSIYNDANYLVRYHLFKEDSGKYVEKDEMFELMISSDRDKKAIQMMPSEYSVKKILEDVDRAWRNWFHASSDSYENHKNKPKAPQYRGQDSYYPFVLCSKDVTIEDKKIKFPNSFHGFTLSPKFLSDYKDVKIMTIEFKFKGSYEEAIVTFET